MRKNMKLNPGIVVVHPTYQDIEDRLFEDRSKVMYQWRYFYPDGINPLHHDMTEPFDKTIRIICYVNASYAGNILDRQ